MSKKTPEALVATQLVLYGSHDDMQALIQLMKEQTDWEWEYTCMGLWLGMTKAEKIKKCD